MAKLKSSHRIRSQIKNNIWLVPRASQSMRESSPHWGGVKMPAWVIATPSIPNCKLIKTYFHYKIKEISKDKTDKKG